MTQKDNKDVARSKGGWQRPSVKYIGHVSEIFQFPGGGKLSLTSDDSGDDQRKPKGQE